MATPREPQDFSAIVTRLAKLEAELEKEKKHGHNDPSRNRPSQAGGTVLAAITLTADLGAGLSVPTSSTETFFWTLGLETSGQAAFEFPADGTDYDQVKILEDGFYGGFAYTPFDFAGAADLEFAFSISGSDIRQTCHITTTRKRMNVAFGPRFLEVGDYVNVTIWQNSGSTQTLTNVASDFPDCGLIQYVKL